MSDDANGPLIGPQVQYPTPWRCAEMRGNHQVIVCADGHWVAEVPDTALAQLIVDQVNRAGSQYAAEFSVSTNEPLPGRRRFKEHVAEIKATIARSRPEVARSDFALGSYFQMHSVDLDGHSTLSLHAIGGQTHLRIQHGTEPRYAVTTLDDNARNDLSNALAQNPREIAEQCWRPTDG